VTQGISLQKLIDQVKKELLAPTHSPDYPLFFVDKVELDLAVAITQGASGEIGISVLDVLSASAKKESSQQYGHTIKITLTPILTDEERRILLDKDGRLRKRIEQITATALIKGDDNLLGSPE